MFVSYAQNFEDVMLWRALRSVERGVYIDIGAQDPVVDSVSLAFFERGWRGVHVEPAPHYARLLREQRPGDVVVEAAVGSGGGLINFYVIPGTGISTADSRIAEQHRAAGWPIQETVVTCVPLSAIFSACQGSEIHWLKIDIEGFETSAIASWGDSSRLPWVVVVESTLPLSQIESHEAWEPMLLERGYRRAYFDGLNRYYVAASHAELIPAFEMPPNVFDDFAINGTASNKLHHLMATLHKAEVDSLLADKRAAASDAESERVKAAESAQASSAAVASLEARLDQNRAETLAVRERGAADLVAASERHAHEVRGLSLSLENAQRDLEAQRKATQEQSELLIRTSSTLASVATEHAAALTALSTSYEKEGRVRDERERELEASLGQLRNGLNASEDSRRRSDVDLASSVMQVETLRAELDSAGEMRRGLTERVGQLGQQLSRARSDAVALRSHLEEIRRGWYWRLFGSRDLLPALSCEVDDESDDALARSGAPIAGKRSPSSSDCARLPMTETDFMSSNTTDPHVRVSTAQELLLLHDVMFVNSAYWAILQREADRDGRADYVTQLRSGVAKEEILSALASSEEGVRAGARLDGFEQVLQAVDRSKLTFFQRVIRRLFKGVHADLDRNFRRLENLVFRLSSANTNRLESLELRLLELADEWNVQAGPDVKSQPSGGQERLKPAPVEARVPVGLQAMTEQQRLVMRKLSKL